MMELYPAELVYFRNRLDQQTVSPYQAMIWKDMSCTVYVKLKPWDGEEFEALLYRVSIKTNKRVEVICKKGKEFINYELTNVSPDVRIITFDQAFIFYDDGRQDMSCAFARENVAEEIFLGKDLEEKIKQYVDNGKDISLLYDTDTRRTSMVSGIFRHITSYDDTTRILYTKKIKIFLHEN